MNLKEITQEGISYADYRAKINRLVAEGKTTGLHQSEAFLKFTKLNAQRMNRLDKTIELRKDTVDRIHNAAGPAIWLLIGEAWCGDCAQIIPIMNKFAEASSGKIGLNIISRDAFPELIKQYHSNGSLSIPKLLVIDRSSWKVTKTWGPRPKPAQDIMHHWKANQDKITREEFERNLHQWYANDRGLTIVRDLEQLLSLLFLYQ